MSKNDKMTDEELGEIEKDVLKVIYCKQYFEYIKVHNKQFIFEHDGKFLKFKHIEKIFKSFARNNDTDKWKNFIRKFSKIAAEDNEWEEWSKRQLSTCEKCGFCPVTEEKCSKYHKYWKQAKVDWEKEFPGDKFECIVTKVSCPECDHSYWHSCDVDEEPNKGIA